jgi:hypothetical protein
MILNFRGEPTPPSDIVARLAQVHPALALRFVSGAWAVTWTWAESDPRRERIRQGEIPEESAHDIVGYLPIGCSAEEAPAYIERSFKQFPRDDIKQLLERLHHYNTVELPLEQSEQTAAEAVEQFVAGTRKKNPRREKVEVRKT